MEAYWNTKGRIFDIQRYSIHDGNGIRTIVFLKGCVPVSYTHLIMISFSIEVKEK